LSLGCRGSSTRRTSLSHGIRLTGYLVRGVRELRALSLINLEPQDFTGSTPDAYPRPCANAKFTLMSLRLLPGTRGSVQALPAKSGCYAPSPNADWPTA
jgi:hypothetical protein